MGKNLWGDINFKDKQVVYEALGNLHYWMRKHGEEFWIAHLLEEHEITDRKTEKPEDLEWSRWALNNSRNTLTLKPVFPDLPLMVHSEYPLRLNHGSKIQIFTRIPLWIRISVDQKGKEYILEELPTVPMSKTWFGTPMVGETCYWSSTKARRSLPAEIYRPHLINCPIWITNKSNEDLDFEKFCYRVERLSVYLHKDQLWADETDIVYQGEELNSEITMTGKLPANISKAKLITPPRKHIHKSFATQTFKRFFDETPLLGR